MATTITLPAASGRRATPAATALWASLSRIVNHLIHRITRAHARRHDPGSLAPNPCYLAKGGEK